MMIEPPSAPPDVPAETPRDGKAVRDAARREAGLVARMRRHQRMK